jgi:hypothetical protein
MGVDQVTARIDPLDNYIWRSTLVGCGRLHREWGRRPDAVSNPRKKISPNPQICVDGAIRAAMEVY